VGADLQAIGEIPLSEKARETLALLLEGAFTDEQRRVEAVDAALTSLSESTPGEIVDLFASLRSSGAWTQKLSSDNPFADAQSFIVAAGALKGALEKQAGPLSPSADSSALLAWAGKVKPKELLKGLSRQDKLKLYAELEPRFQQELRIIDELVKAFAESTNFKIEPEAQGKVVRILLKEYFSRISLRQKRDIVVDFLRLPAKATFEDRLGAVFGNAGPQIQKMFQLFARDPKTDPRFAAILERLESGVKAVPFEGRGGIHEHLLKTVPGLYPSRILRISRKPVGTGTMSQAHRALYRDGAKGEQVIVLRTLKPGIREAIASEQAILLEIAPIVEALPEVKGTEFESFGAFLEGLEKNVASELDVDLTVRNQQKAIALYQNRLQKELGDVSLAVPEVFNAGNTRGEVILMAFAKDSAPMAEFFKHDPAKRLQVSEAIARVWLDEALFGSGFYHSDLHQGNMLVSRRADGGVLVTLLDYGMANSISAEQRGSFIRLAAQIAAKNEDGVVETLEELLVKNPGPEKLRQAVRAGLASNAVGPLPVLLEVSVVGGAVPHEFFGFARGFALVDQLVKSNGGQGAEALVSELALKRLGRETPRRMLSALIGRSGMSEKGGIPLSNLDMLRLAREQVSMSCRQILGRLKKTR